MANANLIRRQFQFAAWVIGLSVGASALSHAATTDLASSPLSSTSSSVVRPNVLFTLDNSGSMDWNYLPDYAGGQVYSGGTANHCKVSNTCGNGETPFKTNEYNGMAYNPRIAYQLPVNADGTLKASQGSPWTAVKVDGYGIQSTSTINMTNGYPEKLYCNSGVCKKNGVDTNNPFLLRATISADNPPVYAFPGSLTTGSTVSSTPHDGAMNQATSTSGTVFNGTLDISTSDVTTTLAGVSVAGGATALAGLAISHSGSTVTVDYTAVSPALVNGDTVVVSGCSSGYESSGDSLPITVVSATRFTYTSTSGSNWGDTTCNIQATRAVTVTYTAISPALATGDTVVVSGSSCSSGYKSGGNSRSITVIDATHFKYTSNSGSNWGSTSCTVNATQAGHTAVAPKISKAGSTVTVTLASAPTGPGNGEPGDGGEWRGHLRCGL